MAISTRIDPIDRDIALIIDEEMSPEARSAFLARYAEEQIEEVRMQNAQVIGQVPDYEVAVDGRPGAALETVKPDGVIIAEYDLLMEVFAWIGAQLVTSSPHRSGRYAASHVFLADGVEVDPAGAVPDATEYVFLNAQPYARKIDRGLSSQAPDGVYQAVAAMATRRFGNIARVYFGYRSLIGGDVGTWAASSRMATRAPSRNIMGSAARRDWLTRQPAIIIRLGS